MLAPFLVRLRENVKAALIAGKLRQKGCTHWMKGLWIGIALATSSGLLVAMILQTMAGSLPQQEQELFAEVIAIAAICVLAWRMFWVKNTSRRSAVAFCLRCGF